MNVIFIVTPEVLTMHNPQFHWGLMNKRMITFHPRISFGAIQI